MQIRDLKGGNMNNGNVLIGLWLERARDIDFIYLALTEGADWFSDTLEVKYSDTEKLARLIQKGDICTLFANPDFCKSDPNGSKDYRKMTVKGFHAYPADLQDVIAIRIYIEEIAAWYHFDMDSPIYGKIDLHFSQWENDLKNKELYHQKLDSVLRDISENDSRAQGQEGE